MIVDERLVRAVKEQYKIKNDNLARAIASQIQASEEALGLRSHYEGLRKAFGPDYANSQRVRDYRRRVYDLTDC